ncbi:hypothetical protein EI427_16210 [Flammeovirga pectinis]|uniref:Uncharacterized protein n=1 Tax=Flammeovirga pectinis TaxID=2494373 RepID=A0A3Q9FSL5_9BACT|nr:hypothetical protein [Flammeovirga pectinis]AZQ63710.1 hypothetical protein EI427_16210 [Flammeovirga pectinis]
MNKNIYSILIIVLLGLGAFSCNKSDENVLTLAPKLEIINHKDIIKVSPFDTVSVVLKAAAQGNYELREINNDDRYLSKFGLNSNSNGKVANATYKFISEGKKGTYDYVFSVKSTTGLIQKVVQKVEVITDASSITIDGDSYKKKFNAEDKVILTGTITTVKDFSHIYFSTSLSRSTVDIVSQNAIIQSNYTSKNIKILETKLVDIDKKGVRTFTFKIEVTIPDLVELNNNLKSTSKFLNNLNVSKGEPNYYDDFSIKVTYTDENTVYYNNKGSHDVSQSWEHTFDIN